MKGLCSPKEIQPVFNKVGACPKQRKQTHTYSHQIWHFIVSHLWNTQCVCVCVCAHVCVCWRKASGKLTDVCFWCLSAVLMFVNGLFKVTTVCCSSRTTGFHSHMLQLWIHMPTVHLSLSPPLSLWCPLNSLCFFSDNRMIKMNGTREPLEFKSHQWFGASVRTHKGKVVVGRSWYDSCLVTQLWLFLFSFCRHVLLFTTGGQWSWAGKRTRWGLVTWLSRTSAPTPSTRPAGPVSPSGAVTFYCRSSLPDFVFFFVFCSLLSD